MAASRGAAIYALATHEVRRLTGGIRGKNLWILGVGVVLLAAAAPAVLQRGIDPERGLHPVVLEPGSASDAAALDDRFRAPAFDQAVLVLQDGVYLERGPAGRAARHDLAEALRAWQEARLALEEDHAAAFPVVVDLLVAPRVPATPSSAAPTPTPDAPTSAPVPTDPAPPPVEVPVGPTPPRTDLRPSEVEPPFPVRSLILSFAYVIPLNFVAQAYAGTLLAERTRRRALLLLTTPHAPSTLLLGRSLPYIAAAGAILLGATVLLGAGFWGFVAATPIVLAMLALALLVGLLARSPRELTFLITGLTTFLTIFLFLPAVFTALPPVAYLSPVSAILDGIEGRATDWGAFLYATTPLTLAAVALGGISLGMWNAETLWSTRSLGHRIRAGLSRWTKHPKGQLAAGVLAVPFALGLELLILSLLIPLGLIVAFPAFVVAAALIEESVKRVVTASAPPPGARAGLWVGGGFFLGEKLALLVALAGFAELDLGVPSLQLWGASGGLLLLLGPLLLHTVTASTAGIGAHARPWTRRLWLLVAVLVHILYNAVVLVLGGAL